MKLSFLHSLKVKQPITSSPHHLVAVTILSIKKDYRKKSTEMMKLANKY